jgi:NAD(P)-dependent dehydrogenase (short-subunit alcohol dehydrogenase family)
MRSKGHIYDATDDYERENMHRNGREQWDWERDGARSGPDGRADMSSQASVRALAEEIRQRAPRFEVLVNNAGSGASAATVSADGIEMTLATNHLGPALLTLLCSIC